MSDADTSQAACSGCNEPVKVYFMCDKESDEKWCFDCFQTRPCVTVPHSEGCETMVLETNEYVIRA